MIFLFVLTYLVTLHPYSTPLPSSFPSSTLTNPSPLPHLLLLRQGEAPLGYHPALGYLVAEGLNTSSPTETSLFRGRDPKAGRSQRWPLLQLLGDPPEDQALHPAEGLEPACACFPVGG